MVIEPLHPDLLENQNRSKPKHGHPDDSDDGAKQNRVNLLELAKLFGQSCAQSGMQDPLNGLIQIEDNAAGSQYALPQIDLIPELPDTKLGSKQWYAETLGSGVGSIFPFLATELATKRIGGTAPWMALRTRAESVPLASQILGLKGADEYLSHMAKTSLDGAFYGGALVPVSDPDNDFWQQRGNDLLSVGVTFGSQYGVSHGVLNGIEKSGWGHMHFHDESTLTLKSGAFRMGANLVGGSAAGLIGTESMSMLYGQGAANPDNVKNAVASFAVTGLSLDLAHIAEHKLVGHKSKEGEDGHTDAHGGESGDSHGGAHEDVHGGALEDGHDGEGGDAHDGAHKDGHDGEGGDVHDGAHGDGEKHGEGKVESEEHSTQESTEAGHTTEASAHAITVETVENEHSDKT